MLEVGEKTDNSFWTLTYQEMHLPLLANGLSSLEPRDVQLFMKRIRKEWVRLQSSFGVRQISALRFYLVGEYGDYYRPHYHLALFGYPACTYGDTLRSRGRPIADRCCVFCRTIHSTWGKGDIHGGRMEEGSAKYLVGYVLKKMTNPHDGRLNGRYPEFARMSNRPGIGQAAMHDVADVMLQLGLDKSEPDVPSALRRGSRIWPLGRYLTQQLRLMTGKEKNAPQEVLDENAKRLLPLREAAKRDNQNPSFKSHLVKAFEQDVLNRKVKAEIFKPKRSL